MNSMLSMTTVGSFCFDSLFSTIPDTISTFFSFKSLNRLVVRDIIGKVLIIQKTIAINKNRPNFNFL